MLFFSREQKKEANTKARAAVGVGPLSSHLSPLKKEANEKTKKSTTQKQYISLVRCMCWGEQKLTSHAAHFLSHASHFHLC